MTIHIGRREFITLLGSAMVAWPAMSIAHPAGGPPRVGVLMRVAEDDPNARDDVQAFQRGLEKLGWTAGRNILIDYRWAAGSNERAQTLANELVELKPNVLVAYGTAMLEAIRRATKTIPTVFTMVSDPVGQGFVVSLSRPGGHATGFTSFEFSTGGKWLELIREASPSIKRAGVIFNPVTAPYATSYLHSIESAAIPFAVDVTGAPIHNAADIERVIKAFGQDPGGGLIVVPDTFTDVHAGSIIALAARYRLPTVYPYTHFARDGGLLSYGPDIVDQFRRAAIYIDRILRGEKPSNLPVQQPTTFRFVINKKAAKAAGLQIPDRLLAIADDVIE